MKARGKQRELRMTVAFWSLIAILALQTSPRVFAWTENSVVLTAPVFYVIGLVEKPGAYEFREPVTVEAAIKMAGGKAHDAPAKVRFRILRRVDGKHQNIAATSSTPVMADDSIIVEPDQE